VPLTSPGFNADRPLREFILDHKQPQTGDPPPSPFFPGMTNPLRQHICDKGKGDSLRSSESLFGVAESEDCQEWKAAPSLQEETRPPIEPNNTA